MEAFVNFINWQSLNLSIHLGLFPLSYTVLVSIRSALITNIKFGEAFGCLFFAMSIVKIRLQKVRLNFHRRMARDVSSFERLAILYKDTWTQHPLL